MDFVSEDNSDISSSKMVLVYNKCVTTEKCWGCFSYLRCCVTGRTFFKDKHISSSSRFMGSVLLELKSSVGLLGRADKIF